MMKGILRGKFFSVNDNLVIYYDKVIHWLMSDDPIHRDKLLLRFP
jgi:hypothetical protein